MITILNWQPAPYRRHQWDVIADCHGVGRYRAKRVKNSAGFYFFDTLLNGDALRRSETLDAAKQYAEEHARRILATGTSDNGSAQRQTEPAPEDKSNV